jgi:hypothetical protein
MVGRFVVASGLGLVAVTAGCLLSTDLRGLSTGGAGGPSEGDEDGSADAPAVANIASGQSNGATNLAVATLPNPTQSGDFLAVLVTGVGSGSVASIGDDAPGGSNAYVSANAKAYELDCTCYTEIWYARNVRAGARTVTVTTVASNSSLAWVMELSGINASNGADLSAVANTQPVATVVVAPSITPPATPALVLSVVASCATISSVQDQSGFTDLPILEGNVAAYRIVTDPGSYGAVWNQDAGGWCASTAAFR